MSKILDASCVAGVVTVEALPIDATILSQGFAESTGVVVLEEEKATYITSNSEDIEEIITQIGGLIDKIILIATSLDAVTVSPGTAAANIAALGVLKTTFMLKKDNLK